LSLADFKICDKSVSLLDIPNEVLDVFNMEACKSAVKFGDELSNKQCKSLVDSLAKTQNWLHCAHGRPTILPLTNIFNPNVS
jgi:DNA mismatch repair protein MLH3